MKALNLLAIATVVLLASCGGQKQQNESGNPILTVSGGQIQGVVTDSTDVIVYKGIPYAAAPVGDLRWQKPQPVTPWEGVRTADTWGNVAIQAALDNGGGGGNFYVKEFYQDGLPQSSEDCLYLNVWTPRSAAGNADSKLPVAMWIHGGAYDHGWGYEITMDGQEWAKRGVILVTINYRVGIIGFLAHPELSAEADGVSGNYGTLDQIAALKWIRENISQFGGDPDNITILGQSAGASSIKNLCLSPESKGLISRAIIQSGGGISGKRSDTGAEALKAYEEQGKNLMDSLGYTTLEQMRAIPASELLKIQQGANMRFRPVTDGKYLPQTFDDATLDGNIADVPYMIGYCANDIGSMGESIKLFCETRNAQSKQPAYMYLFARALPGDDAGAFHSSELWYTFHTLDRSWRPFTAADYKLADEMTDSWTNFAKYGNPNGQNGGSWTPCTKDNSYVQEFQVSELE